MKVIGIVCAGLDGSIGYKNDLVWKSSQDLKHVKETTIGHALIMGRKTYETLPKRGLPDRLNIVISSSYPQGEAIEDRLYIVDTPEKALQLAKDKGHEKAFIFGGSQIYSVMFERSYMEELLLTQATGTAGYADTFLDPILFKSPYVLKYYERLDSWEEGNVGFLLFRLVYNHDKI